MARKPVIENISEIVTQAAEERELEWEEKYTDFVLWVVKTLNPASFLPPISDEAYARKLIEALVMSESNLRKEIKQKEKHLGLKIQILQNNNKEFKKRINELEKQNKEIREDLKELKEDILEHGEDLVESAEEKTFLDTLKSYSTKLFKR